MLPVVFRVPEWVPLMGAQPVTSFGVLLLAAILAGGTWLARELGQRGVPRGTAWDLVVVAAVGGLAGARLLHVAFHPQALSGGLGDLFARSGLDGVGALVGAAAAVAWRARSRGLSLGPVADAAAPALALAYGIGRVGSFLAGTGYGRPTSSILGVAFRRGAPPTTPANLLDRFGIVAPPDAMVGDHVLVHPTQLYESGVALAAFAVLVRWGPRPGAVRFGAFLVLAGLERFAVDFLRASGAGAVLSAERVAALAVVTAGVVVLIRDTRTGKDGETC